MALTRLRRYPPSFVFRHPMRSARNLVGNHPSRLANKYLAGLHGVEIGAAAYNDFYLDTINVDYQPVPDSAPLQLKHTGRITPVDVVAQADQLPFDDAQYEFVLASHVLEHIPDPISALTEWSRVASRYIYVALPHPDNEWNADRPPTPLKELFERHCSGFRSDLDMHWTVWSSTSFAEFCDRLGIGIIEIQDPDDKRGNGFAAVLNAIRSPGGCT